MMRFAAALVLLLGAAGCAAPRQTAVEKTDSAATEVRTVRDSVSRSVELRFDTVEMTVVRRDSTIVWLRGSGASVGARRTDVSADSATVSVARNGGADNSGAPSLSDSKAQIGLIGLIGPIGPISAASHPHGRDACVIYVVCPCISLTPHGSPRLQRIKFFIFI